MPYSANPPPLSSARNDREAQIERYSFLATKLYKMHTSGLGPDWLKTSPDRIYDQLRSSRVLPAYPKDVDEKTVKRLENFERRVLRWPKSPKLSVKGLAAIVEGGSE